MDDGLYKAQVACAVCDVSPRMIDYWVTRGVLTPTKTYRGPLRRRDFFLFSFEDLVRIRILRSLREAGVSLLNIRAAIQELRLTTGSSWQKEWLVTDGKTVYRATGDKALETLSGSRRHQLAFAVVALGHAGAEVRAKLREGDAFATLTRGRAFPTNKQSGRVTAYKSRRERTGS